MRAHTDELLHLSAMDFPPETHGDPVRVSVLRGGGYAIGNPTIYAPDNVVDTLIIDEPQSRSIASYLLTCSLEGDRLGVQAIPPKHPNDPQPASLSFILLWLATLMFSAFATGVVTGWLIF